MENLKSVANEIIRQRAEQEDNILIDLLIRAGMPEWKTKRKEYIIGHLLMNDWSVEKERITNSFFSYKYYLNVIDSDGHKIARNLITIKYVY